jgi:hypothetical protein
MTPSSISNYKMSYNVNNINLELVYYKYLARHLYLAMLNLIDE